MRIIVIWWGFAVVAIVIVAWVCLRAAEGILSPVDLALGIAFGVLVDELVRGSESDEFDDRD